MRYIYAAILVSLVYLTGCSQDLTQLNMAIRTHNLNDLNAVLQTITVADADAAYARALAANDVIGMACYPVLKKYAQVGLPGLGIGKTAGVLDQHEQVRLQAGNIATGAIPPDLRLGCAPMVQDDTDLITRLINMFAGQAAIMGPK